MFSSSKERDAGCRWRSICCADGGYNLKIFARLELASRTMRRICIESSTEVLCIAFLNSTDSIIVLGCDFLIHKYLNNHIRTRTLLVRPAQKKPAHVTLCLENEALIRLLSTPAQHRKPVYFPRERPSYTKSDKPYAYFPCLPLSVI